MEYDEDDLFIEEFLGLEFTVNIDGEVLHIRDPQTAPGSWRFIDIVEEGPNPTTT